MSTRALIPILFCLPLSVFSEPFSAGEVSFDMDYDDSTLTDAERTTIFNDIRQYRTFWTNFTFTVTDDATGDGYLVEQNVALPHIQRRGVRMPREFTRNASGTLLLHVRTTLSNHYKTACIWKSENTNKVDSANQFVAFLNSPELLNTPWTEIANIYYQNSISTDVYQQRCSDILSGIGQYVYSNPSILSFQDIDLSRFGLTGTGTLSYLPCYGKNPTEPLQLYAIPILWFDNHWHLLPDTL